MKAKRRRTMYAMLYNNECVAVKLLRTYVRFGEEVVEAEVSATRHGTYGKGELIVVGYDRIMYKTRGGRYFVAPREDIDARLG